MKMKLIFSCKLRWCLLKDVFWLAKILKNEYVSQKHCLDSSRNCFLAVSFSDGRIFDGQILLLFRFATSRDHCLKLEAAARGLRSCQASPVSSAHPDLSVEGSYLFGVHPLLRFGHSMKLHESKSTRGTYIGVETNTNRVNKANILGKL